MIDDDDDIDEYVPPPPLPPYDEALKELGSAYKSSTHGAMKEITGVTLGESVSDLLRGDITAKVAIGNYQESPGCEYSGSYQRVFDLSLADIRRLAETAPEYRSNFAFMAEKLDEKLQKDVAAYKRDIVSWCDQGLPTMQATAIRRPLRLKPGT